MLQIIQFSKLFKSVNKIWSLVPVRGPLDALAQALHGEHGQPGAGHGQHHRRQHARVYQAKL